MRLDPLKLGPCVSVSILGGASFTWQIIFTPPDNLCTPTTTKDKAKLLFCQAWLFNGFVKKKIKIKKTCLEELERRKEGKNGAKIW